MLSTDLWPHAHAPFLQSTCMMRHALLAVLILVVVVVVAAAAHLLLQRLFPSSSSVATITALPFPAGYSLAGALLPSSGNKWPGRDSFVLGDEVNKENQKQKGQYFIFLHGRARLITQLYAALFLKSNK